MHGDSDQPKSFFGRWKQHFALIHPPPCEGGLLPDEPP